MQNAAERFRQNAMAARPRPLKELDSCETLSETSLPQSLPYNGDTPGQKLACAERGTVRLDAVTRCNPSKSARNFPADEVPGAAKRPYFGQSGSP